MRLGFGVSGSPSAWNTRAAAAPAGAAPRRLDARGGGSGELLLAFRQLLRSSSISVAPCELEPRGRTPRAWPRAAASRRAPPRPVRCASPRARPPRRRRRAPSPPSRRRACPWRMPPGGGRPSGATPDAAGRERAAPPRSPPRPCSSPISSGATLARTASSLCALNTAPARARAPWPPPTDGADRLHLVEDACSSRSSALVRSIWSLRACLRSISCCASNGSRMIGCVAASSGSSARASTSLRATA